MAKISLALISALLLSILLFASSLVDAVPVAPAVPTAPTAPTSPPAPPAPKTPKPKTPKPKTPKPKAPAPKKDKIPAFTAFSLSDLKGKSEVVSKYGCHELKITEVGSVKYKSGPRAGIVFYTDKNCKGKVTHQMTTDTVKQMGGPYKTQSVKVSK